MMYYCTFKIEVFLLQNFVTCSQLNLPYSFFFINIQYKLTLYKNDLRSDVSQPIIMSLLRFFLRKFFFWTPGGKRFWFITDASVVAVIVGMPYSGFRSICLCT